MNRTVTQTGEANYNYLSLCKFKLKKYATSHMGVNTNTWHKVTLSLIKTAD